jgi:hypothetical protein
LHHALARWELVTLPILIGGSHSVSRILGSRVRELFPQARGCSPKRSSENGPRQRTARRRSWAITRARVGGPSRDRACSYSRASTSLARRHPGLVSLFRGSMAGLQAPLSTLRLAPRDALRMTRGQSGAIPSLFGTFTFCSLSVSRRTPVSDFRSLPFVDLPAH